MRMVGGHFRCLSCFFTCSSVLLLGVCLCGACTSENTEASSHTDIFHKKVGDTVEFPSCYPSDGVTKAQWKHKNFIIADKNRNVTAEQFKGRLYLNLTNFSLTVRALTLQDSGEFSFLSATDSNQRDTVVITLHVHEPITKQPGLTLNSSWNSNKTCTVSLKCRANSGSDVTYKWTVKNHTTLKNLSTSDSTLIYTVEAQDQDTEFTCTIQNYFGEESASITVECNETPSPVTFVLILSIVGGGCLLLVLAVGMVVCVSHRKQPDPHDSTVYADITEVAVENNSCTMKPCSVYETIDNRVSSVMPAPQTVYDKIHFSRGREPYREIS